MPIRCGIVGLAQRRQIDAVQRAHARADRRRELSVLHHRSERRRRAGARSAPGAAGRHRAIPRRSCPTTVEFVDIAGLVAGASQGEGLGNQFLSHIREVDAIAHVVRCFESGDVIHVSGKVDPIADIEIIDTELALADLATLDKGLDRATKAAKSGDKDAIRASARCSSASECSWMRRARCAALNLTEEERRDVRELQLLTAKPVMYVANVAEHGFNNNPLLAALERRAATEGAVRGAGVCGHRGGDRAARRE